MQRRRDEPRHEGEEPGLGSRLNYERCELVGGKRERGGNAENAHLFRLV